MKNNPLVCICIPHYNNQKTISKTLNSIINQTYENIIIKIFDNASTDNSIAILKEYEKKHENIKLFQNEKNIGGEANFTKCIENLEGNYGAIYHADDLYLPNMVKQQVKFLEQHKDCSAVATHAYTINENSNVTGFRFIPKEYSLDHFNIIGNQLELFESILKNSNYITCPSVMGRTQIYKEKIKSWNGKDFKTSADLDVWLRFAEFGKFGLLSEPLMQYRESTSSYSYKDMRTRTDENNMFLVLDYYLTKYTQSSLLTKDDIARYHFLLFKDNLNRTINEVIKGTNTKLQLNIFNKKIFQIAIESKSNFIIYITAIVFKMIRIMKLSESLRKKIFELRFKR